MIALFGVLEYASYKGLEKDLQQRLAQNTRIQAFALSSPLWNYDILSIDPILLALEQDPDFLMAKVEDATGEQIAFLKAPDTENFVAAFTHSLPIKHATSSSQEIIGSITIALHGERMLTRAFDNLKRNVLILLMLIGVIVAATVIAAERAIGIPVRQLLNSIQLVKNSDIRTAVPWQSKDELGEMVAAYNEMLVKQEMAETAIILSEEKTRQSEKRLRDAVDSMSDGFALFDENDNLVLFNNKFRDITPTASHLIVEGTSYENILRSSVTSGDFPEVEEKGAEEYVQMRLNAHRTYDVPTIVRSSGGRWILCIEHRTSTGGIVAVRTDITELKQREVELQLAKEEAEAANQAKSRFLANMSHELRTPLNAILGFSDVIHQEMLGELGSDRYKEYAGDIHTSGTHLLDLINDILDVAKIESGAFEPSNEELSIDQIIVDSIRLIEQRAIARNLILKREVLDGLPSLFADRRAVKQVLLNLLTNAVKFTPDGGKITTSARVLVDGGIEISVADTGPGIAEKEIDIVMRPFGRLESPWTQSEEGTGLGLPLSDMLVKAHGGLLTIKSTPNKGTTVSMSFPPVRSVTI